MAATCGTETNSVIFVSLLLDDRITEDNLDVYLFLLLSSKENFLLRLGTFVEKMLYSALDKYLKAPHDLLYMLLNNTFVQISVQLTTSMTSLQEGGQ